jgi:NAD(P)-dependent dehydrogenase (short-subunit alcohol dehydrogenase family)
VTESRTIGGSAITATVSRERVALVIGASRGLGKLIAAELAIRGWRVIATARDPSARQGLDEAAAAAGADPASLTILPLDVQSSDSIAAAVSEALTLTGDCLDAVIASAGVLIAGSFEETPSEAMRRVMDVNYFGLAETVRATLPAVRAVRGRVVLISSDSGFCGTAGLSGYTASKFALEGWGESLADEVAPLGVKVSIIEPGPFKSEIFSRSQIYRGSPNSPYARLARLTDDALQRLEAGAPPAQPVVAAVMRALSSRNPRLRYPVGAEARVLYACRGLLPERAFRRVARRVTGTSDWVTSPPS